MHFESSTMRRSIVAPRSGFFLALLLIAAGLLTGCETDGTGLSATGAPTAQTAQAPKPAEAAKPAEPAKPEEPMTRARAARECWMKTEKGRADADLDKRADIVTKCIEDKMKAAGAPKT